MKLKCVHHRRRVLVIPRVRELQDSITFSHSVVHRGDGSYCDGMFFRLGDLVMPPQVVALKGYWGKPLRTDRLGYEKEQDLTQRESLSTSLTT